MSVTLNGSILKRRGSPPPSKEEHHSRPLQSVVLHIQKYSDALVCYLKKNDDPKIKDILRILQNDKDREEQFERFMVFAENGSLPVPIPPKREFFGPLNCHITNYFG